MDSVKILNIECRLQFGFYPNNTVSIDAYSIPDDEPYWRLTVNWEKNFEGPDYKKRFQFPMVVIKNYSENEGVFAELVKANVITPGFYLSGTAGTVQSAMLTEKWQEVAKQHLEIL